MLRRNQDIPQHDNKWLVAYQFFGAVLVAAGIATLLLDRTYRNRSENPETPESGRVGVQPS